MNGFYRATVASNIAFLKYWGKRDKALQWPANDSLSMTLDQLKTETRARLYQGDDHLFRFEGRVYTRQTRQFDKAFRHLDELARLLGEERRLEIDTLNHFPIGAGMASSASGLAALTIATLAAWLDAPTFDRLAAQGFSAERLAHLSRLGSGSAGRSLFGGYVVWEAGVTADQQRVWPFAPATAWNLRDTVVVCSADEKSLSSSDAHQEAWSSPLFKPRLAGLPERMKAMQAALERRDMESLGPLLETEALEMHAVIMTAGQPHQYLAEASLDFLVRLRNARQAGKVQAYFTIDAGPNIHVIHEASEHEKLCQWLKSEYPTQLLLHDKVGSGPQLEYVSH